MSLVADAAAPGAERRLAVDADGGFTLKVSWEGREKTVAVPPGRSDIAV